MYAYVGTFLDRVGVWVAVFWPSGSSRWIEECFFFLFFPFFWCFGCLGHLSTLLPSSNSLPGETTPDSNVENESSVVAPEDAIKTDGQELLNGRQLQLDIYPR